MKLTRSLSIALSTAVVCACASSVPCPSSPPPPPPLTGAAPAPTLVPAASVAAPVEATPEERERDTKIDALFSRFTASGPGCALGVYRAGDVVFTRAYGLSSLELGTRIDERSVFDIGSESKQFTGAAIAMLAEEGKLSLDDEVRKYVPELPDYGHPMTLRHLVHHTSGLPEYLTLLMLGGFVDADATDDDDALFAITRHRRLNFAPGTEYSYSGTNYFLLSLVVKRVSGVSLGEFLKRRIFEPLGMNDTVVRQDHTVVIAHRASGYAPRGSGGFSNAMGDFEQAGDGAVQSSIADLARWDANFYSPKVFDAAVLSKLRTVGKLSNGTPIDYAMGLHEGVENGVAREDHGGAAPGYTSEILRFPSERLTVACLCNLATVEPWGLARAVANVVLPKHAAAAASATSSEPAKIAAPEKPAYVLTTSEREALLGSYIDPRTFAVRTISSDNGALRLGFQLGDGGEHAPLAPVGPRTLQVVGRTARYELRPRSGASPARLARIVEGEVPSELERLEPMPSSPAPLREYEGRYVNDALHSDLQVSVVDGKLRIGPSGRTPTMGPLAPLGRDVFSVHVAWEQGGLRFQRDARGRIKGLEFGSVGVRGLTLVRR